MQLGELNYVGNSKWLDRKGEYRVSCRNDRLMSKRRKSNIRGVPLSQIRERILILQDGLCFYCNYFGADTIDHVTPLASKGRNWPTNMVVACDECNQFKASRDPCECELARLEELHQWEDWEQTLHLLYHGCAECMAQPELFSSPFSVLEKYFQRQ